MTPDLALYTVASATWHAFRAAWEGGDVWDFGGDPKDLTTSPDERQTADSKIRALTTDLANLLGLDVEITVRGYGEVEVRVSGCPPRSRETPDWVRSAKVCPLHDGPDALEPGPYSDGLVSILGGDVGDGTVRVALRPPVDSGWPTVWLELQPNPQGTELESLAVALRAPATVRQRLVLGGRTVASTRMDREDRLAYLDLDRPQKPLPEGLWAELGLRGPLHLALSVAIPSWQATASNLLAGGVGLQGLNGGTWDLIGPALTPPTPLQVPAP